MNRPRYTVEFHDKTMDFRIVRWVALDRVWAGIDVDRFDNEQEALECATILNDGEEYYQWLDQESEFDRVEFRE